MKDENNIALKYEMQIKTKIKSTLSNYIRSDILTKKVSVVACRLGKKWFAYYQAAPNYE